MTDPRLYLSANGDNPLSKIAEHTLTKLFARVSMLVAPAAIGFIGAQVLAQLSDIQTRLASIELRQAVQIEQIGQHDRRLDDHKARIGWLERAGRRGDGG